MQKLKIIILGMSVALVAGTTWAEAGEQELMERLEKLERENQELRQRLDALEQGQVEMSEKVSDISLPTAEIPPKTLEFLSQTEIGGGAMATWFSDFSDPGPAGTTIPGEGIGTYNNDAFSINLVEIFLDNPVAVGDENWDGGFRLSVLLGEDVSGLGDGLALGSAGAVWEAYVQANIPILNGVVAKAGKFATYIGNEVVEPWANRQITYGNQFPLIEPFTHTGIALETRLNEQWNLVLSVNNGWDQTFEAGDGPSFLGQLGFTPSENSSVALNGYVGPETGQASEMRSGVDLVANHQINEELSATVQLDAGWQDLDTSATADWYGVGGWLNWDPSEIWGLGLRGDWIKGNEGFPGTGFTTGITESHLTLTSVTGTLTLRPPVPGLEGRVEVRYDSTNDESFFGGVNDRIVLAIAALYSF